MADINPHHAVGVVLILVVVGAGAAAGVTLFGEVTGESVTTVDQAVIVPGENFSAGDVTANSAVVSVSDDGSNFVVGAEAFQGEQYEILLPLQNRANQETTVEVTLQQVAGPDKVSIDVVATGTDEFADNCEIDATVRVSTDKWRFKLPGSCDDRVSIQIAIPADAQPGYYELQGSLRPLEGIK